LDGFVLVVVSEDDSIALFFEAKDFSDEVGGGHDSWVSIEGSAIQPRTCIIHA
jgi:hypothetical protein